MKTPSSESNLTLNSTELKLSYTEFLYIGFKLEVKQKVDLIGGCFIFPAIAEIPMKFFIGISLIK